jgi:hypothetical protein
VMCQSSPADVLGCRAASRESVVPGMCRAQIGCAVIDSSASRPANSGDQVREHAIRSVIELGIDGLVLASSPVCDLLAGIRALSRGSHYLCEPAAQLLDQMPEHEALTEREDDVLRLLARAYATSQLHVISESQLEPSRHMSSQSCPSWVPAVGPKLPALRRSVVSSNCRRLRRRG